MISCKFFYQTIKLKLNQFYQMVSLNDFNDEDTIKLLQQFESLAKFNLVMNRDFQQRFDQPIPIKLKLIRLIFRLIVSITLLRLIGLLFISSNCYQTIIADPLIDVKGRESFIMFTIVFISTHMLIHEMSLIYEKQGRYIALRIFSQIKSNRFSPDYLNINLEQIKLFKKIFHFVLIIIIRLSQILIVSTILLPLLIRLANSKSLATYQLIVSSFFWIIIEATVLAINVLGGALIGGCMILYSIILYFQLDKIDRFSLSLVKYGLTNPHEKQIKSLNVHMIKYMNRFDKLIDDIRYMLLVLFLLISFCGDSFIFIGLTVDTGSKLWSNSLVAFGFYFLIFVGIGGYICGFFYLKVNN
ncbi:uncharacterized protein LOC128392944 [Panonychus citri]|uniref:uncharacterized protein LOC128392944 n=1 Tax=Panonychus citri TaxID=50023 RepID=UPI0023074F6B|nr:uncharacterized protein LOC128392944 [Panonychus citri]XP_053209013.1 uncharacterized protein LOC128392944 [Panonychus citri]